MADEPDVRIDMTRDATELAAAAELVCAYVDGVNSASVRRWFREAANEPRTFVAVAVDRELVVGTILSRVDERLSSAASAENFDTYHLLQYAAVAPRWRHRGIGSRLVDFVRARLRAGGTRWWIGGAENAAAGEFFARCGMTVLAPDAELPLPPDGQPSLRSSRPGYRWFHQTF